MMESEKPFDLAFLSTYPPRACGIATFTQDLIQELKKKSDLRPRVIAVSDGNETYGGDVLLDFPQQDRESYPRIAERINRSAIRLLVVEHEYGIYGGECGAHLLELIRRVEKPVVTTLHTVLPSPNEKQREILSELCRESEAIVTMAANTRSILRNIYGCSPDKIVTIHHGVPSFDLPPREILKRRMHLEGRPIVSTFGLIGPGKGLEFGIEAIGRVAREHPEVLYLILGQTHPAIRKASGESYREGLEKQVRDLGLEDNVRFVNRYLTKEEIVRWLRLSDIYMTPYLGRDQAVSGTLAYAVGYGRVIVSTPYLYAREMLADGRGMLAEFEDAGSIGRCIQFLIEHPKEKEEMEQRTLRLGETMRWDAVAECYRTAFYDAYHKFWNRRNTENEGYGIQAAE